MPNNLGNKKVITHCISKIYGLYYLKRRKLRFNNEYVLSKIREIEQYHSSALHWNLNELSTNLHNIIDKVKAAYEAIEKTTNIKLHNSNGLDNFKDRIGNDVSQFMDFSREKSQQAQAREFVTAQPKESLATLSKAKVTISNYLGGKYFLTVDEVKVSGRNICLIEGKHTAKSLLPSKGDIKDGLLKMILYSNLSGITISDKQFTGEAVLNLTSSRLKGEISSKNSKELEQFFAQNNFSQKQRELVQTIFSEAIQNNFTINIFHL